MLKNSAYGQSGGSHCFQEAYPVGRRESVKHWFFKERQRPPANPPDTSQSRSGCPPSSPSRRLHDPFKKSNVPGVRSCASRGRCKMWFQRPGALCGASAGHDAAPEGLSLPGKSLRLTPSQRQRGFSCPPRWIPSPPSVPPAHGCGAPSAPSAAPWCGFSHCPGRRCR